MKGLRIDRYIGRINKRFRAVLHGGREDEAAWHAIRDFHFGGNTVIFHRARSLCSSVVAHRRMRGVDILAQLRSEARRRPHFWGSHLYRDESAALIRQMLEAETDVDALDSEIVALGHLGDELSLPAVIALADHANENIRFSVTFFLGKFHDEPAAVEALAKLMDDPDKDVRNWAIFYVGNIGNSDSDLLREIFSRHVNDPYRDARQEAVAALAKRHDGRAILPLLQMLRHYGDVICLCEAAHSLLRIDEWPKPKWDAGDYIAALELAFPEHSQIIKGTSGPEPLE